MTRPITVARRLLATLAVSGVLVLIGCSDDGLARRYPVSGKVTFKGQPLKTGRISFVPEAPDGRGAGAEIVDGAYTLTTQEPGDGAFPGKYKVSVVVQNLDMQEIEAASKKLAEKAKAQATQIDPALVAKATRKTKHEIPEKYSSPQSSGLEAEVKSG